MRPQVLPSTSALLSGPPVRKLLFMADAPTITSAVLPLWRAALQGQGAEVMQVRGRKRREVQGTRIRQTRSMPVASSQDVASSLPHVIRK